MYLLKSYKGSHWYWEVGEVIGTGRWGKSLVLGGGLGLEHLQHIIV